MDDRKNDSYHIEERRDVKDPDRPFRPVADDNRYPQEHERPHDDQSHRDEQRRDDPTPGEQ